MFRKKTRPQPSAVDPAAVAAGLRAFAHDLDAGDTFALDCLGSRADMPSTAEGWAAYPAMLIRRVRIAHFGKPGPGEIPAEVEAELFERLAA